MPIQASDDLREYFDERPGLHAAILGAMGFASALATFLLFRSGEKLYRGWAALLLTVVFLGQCAYRLWQVRQLRTDD